MSNYSSQKLELDKKGLVERGVELYSHLKSINK